MLMGWATGYFGIFVDAEPMQDDKRWLNYLGPLRPSLS